MVTVVKLKIIKHKMRNRYLQYLLSLAAEIALLRLQDWVLCMCMQGYALVALHVYCMGLTLYETDLCVYIGYGEVNA